MRILSIHHGHALRRRLPACLSREGRLPLWSEVKQRRLVLLEGEVSKHEVRSERARAKQAPAAVRMSQNESVSQYESDRIVKGPWEEGIGYRLLGYHLQENLIFGLFRGI